MKSTTLRAAALACLLPLLTAEAAFAGVKILFPLGRVTYQTNEWIDVSVVRSGAVGLKKGRLVLALTGPDGSRLDFTFPVKAAEGKPALASEHLHLNGALLRPGKYTLHATADGDTAREGIEVYSHIRGSTFKTIDWGSRASKHEQALLGPDSMGFNTMLYAYGGIDRDEMIRGGLDYMRCCALGGWHYMDLRRECDWSDPYVLGGGIARASRQAFEDRINPNCLGVHFYDEPMLVEVKDPKDPKKMVRYGVPAQERSFRSMFGKDAPKFGAMNFGQPEDVRRWMKYNRWRLLLLEAAWRLSCDSVTRVRPDFLPTSQTEWAWHAFDEGYYFNVNRPFPIVSRHAWYDYKHGGDFAPSFSFEFGRIRDLNKPNWFLPMWGSGHSDLYRAEQYLSFMNNLHGIAKPPDLLAHRPSRTAVAPAIVEANKTALRLGTIFETMPVTRADVAVLYSMSHNLHEETRHRVNSYGGNEHFQRLLYVYMASKILHVPVFPVVEEDVRDGTLAAHHKVVIVAGIEFLPRKLIAGLEAFIAGGGAVLVSDDCKVQVKGATKFHFPPEGIKLIAQMDKWASDKQWGKWSATVQSNLYFKEALKVARALEPKLADLGVKPVFHCDQPGVVASRQALGDIEYLFTVNASPDFDTFGWYYLKPVTATLGLGADGGPVYDAVRGGRAGEFEKQGKKLQGQFRFGPGEMRVFARTARPIGGVQVLTPLLFNDYTVEREPIRVEINALLVDDQKQVLCGSAPLRIEVIDPLKVKRFDLYRATNRGMLRLTLPLAANDPAGAWTVVIHDLLGNTHGKASFWYRPPAQCAALAGATRRAVALPGDRNNIFRFFRTHKDLTLITGSGAFNQGAAERLAKVLEPWDVRCKIIKAADVKRRTLSAREKPTWVDGSGAFELRGPAVLLGNPDDNPLIRHLQEQKFLPYTPARDGFPGRGRGLIAWQRDALAYFGHESLTLIAYDEAGLAEAVGSVYTIAAGLKPLTPRVLPDQAVVQAATTAPTRVAEPPVAWRTTFPDRVVAVRELAGDALVLSADGTLRRLKPGGKVAWQKTFSGGESWSLDVAHDGKLIVVGAAHRLYALDANGKQLFERTFDESAPKEQIRSDGIAFVAIAPGKARILVALGRHVFAKGGWEFSNTLSLWSPRGKKLWEIGGIDKKTGKPVIPERYRFGAFSADGKTFILLGDKKTEVADADSGYFGKSVKGSFVAAVRLGENVLLGDGDSGLVLYSLTRQAVVSRLDCAGAGPVTFAPAAGGVIVGTETDGTVRRVKALSGKLKDQAVWQDRVSTHIVKKVAVNGDRVAVCYWGGTVRILDRSGKLVGEKVFSQDVSALAWTGGRLVAGLADGKVVALQVIPRRQ